MQVSKTRMKHWIMQVLALMGISITMLAIAVARTAADGHTRSSSGMSRSTLHRVRVSHRVRKSHRVRVSHRVRKSHRVWVPPTLHHVRISGNVVVRDEFHRTYSCTAFASYDNSTGESYIHVELWAADTQFVYVNQYTYRPLRSVDGYIMFTADATRNSSLVGRRVPVIILFKENPRNEDQGYISIRDLGGDTFDRVRRSDGSGYLYVFAD